MTGYYPTTDIGHILMSKTHTYTTSQKKRELELADKLAQYGELNGMLLNLFYTVFHNLNTYTGNIKMLLDLMDSEDAIENEAALGHLRCVSDDLNKTIADLSQIMYVRNKIDISKETLNLNQYLNKINNVINGYHNESKVRFINNVPDAAVVIFNPAYLESILLNFCTNAIKYAHPDRFPTVAFNLVTENNKQVLTIRDNGLGIDLERFGDSLFGLNQTFHQHENSNGFGLYITKYQIESMKGMVSVDSKVGEGTTFKIHFCE